MLHVHSDCMLAHMTGHGTHDWPWPCPRADQNRVPPRAWRHKGFEESASQSLDPPWHLRSRQVLHFVPFIQTGPSWHFVAVPGEQSYCGPADPAVYHCYHCHHRYHCHPTTIVIIAIIVIIAELLSLPSVAILAASPS